MGAWMGRMDRQKNGTSRLMDEYVVGGQMNRWEKWAGWMHGLGRWVDRWDGTDEAGDTFQNLNQPNSGRRLTVYYGGISRMDGWIKE